jgi:hypothetical protein
MNEEITNKKPVQQLTPAEMQREKLSALYKLAGLDIRPGAACRAKCVITGVNEIQKKKDTPLNPEEIKEVNIEYNDIAIFNNVAYDYHSAKLYLEFVSGEQVVYYSYSDHGPFSIPFGQMLEKVFEGASESILK